jgi:hypothetical protein
VFQSMTYVDLQLITVTILANRRKFFDNKSAARRIDNDQRKK